MRILNLGLKLFLLNNCFLGAREILSWYYWDMEVMIIDSGY